jgi:molybdopterin-guanine dinucleotide biosynthesis protein A
MGRDKRFLQIGNMSLLDWVLTRLRPLVAELIVVAQGPGPLDGLEARVVQDRYAGMGVLAGLHAGLEAASHPWAFVLAGDMPLLNPDLLRAMARLADADTCDLVVPRWRGFLEPLHGLYLAPACAPAAERALRKGQRRIVAFYPEVRVKVMAEADVRQWDRCGDSFFNVNTLQDWEIALKRLGL